IRLVGDGAVVHVRGKGRKDRRVPVEAPFITTLEVYLASRRARFPGGQRRGSSPAGGLASWPADAPLFVNVKDGTRITRSTVQYRVLRLFRRAGIDSERQRGALVHGLRHTYATDLANAQVSVYELKTLLGHKSIATSQRYVDGAGQETRTAAARNPLYERLRRRD
ncbi:MAG TPA: tyrosine-type recombinase/integrase, partial [Mycobacterium sp.]|nr:tyrosine-type recombinase/integrase [Mycobacterium sp.]